MVSRWSRCACTIKLLPRSFALVACLHFPCCFFAFCSSAWLPFAGLFDCPLLGLVLPLPFCVCLARCLHHSPCRFVVREIASRARCWLFLPVPRLSCFKSPHLLLCSAEVHKFLCHDWSCQLFRLSMSSLGIDLVSFCHVLGWFLAAFFY